ncbi:GNAT family N-acetyltransferase [Streptomyces sp. XM4011]|uniref:GNAT family N-acetyltransferase n=1 Tax=Streptomyces sp. XM4011 TaxID=2929780 RepID=UPI001FF9E317|nr:GNAT family N-acetyltransferase [Streptomyces sp. XM4011]MCK1817821.1 GNAT family N-acetyltransferase [Streptomyces sp. XM4011]
MDRYAIRTTRREDWARLRELRLAALLDPLAEVAFYQTYEAALEIPRQEWERRAAGERTTTFIGYPVDPEDPAGSADPADFAVDKPWAGMVTVFPEPDTFAGTDTDADSDTNHVTVVGVYVRPEHRGTGLARNLMRRAIDWAGEREVRLRVHENNPRAARFYASLGFRPNGVGHPDPRMPGFRAVELTLPVRR